MSDSPRRDQNPDDPNLPPLPDAELSIPDYPLTVPEPAPGRAVIRMLPYHEELNPRGIVITCTRCGACRDWLLLETRGLVFVRCRCNHEWREEDLSLEFFEENFAYPERAWKDAAQALVDLGYDGQFAGIYFN